MEQALSAVDSAATSASVRAKALYVEGITKVTTVRQKR
jgi:hypothetical protein